MVVRETLQMADSLVRSELRVPAPASVEPLTVDVLGDRDADSTVTTSLNAADEPSTYQVKQGGTRLSSQNLAALTTGLKIVTSLRGHFVTKMKSVDGLSASSRRSEDDDGYCSRSSLDSPVQITRPDAVSPTAEDSAETFREPTSPAPDQRQEATGSCDGANDEVKIDCNSQTVAAVANLDHCYLTAKTPLHDEAPVDDGGDVPQSVPDRASVDDAAVSSLSTVGRRNISIFVVPQPMPSSGLRWRARIIRADATSPDETDASHDASSTPDAEKQQASTAEAPTSSWVPLSAACGRVKPTLGTSATTHARQSSGYRQRLTVGSQLAALTATADSLSRKIARVAASSARTGGREVRQRRGAGTDRRRAADYHLRDLSVRLHPLVDHDYGAFATFNAEVQSSIISTTTDGVSQLDWRSIRRHRNTGGQPRPKQGVAERETIQQPGLPSGDSEYRPKRKYCRRQQQDLVYGLGTSYVRARVAASKPHPRAPGRKGRPPSLDTRRQPVPRKRFLPESPSSASVGSDDGKSYVKIPGQYQDEFVYYATKRARGRPRKSLYDATTSNPSTNTGHTPSRPTAVGGINVFDWYREMANTDKSTRFGIPAAASPDVRDGHPEASAGWADTTPVDESAVADLVMDMLPASTAPSCSVSNDYPGVTSTFSRSELTVTEEDVCAMLRSLNEADLKMIESHLDNATVDHDDCATKNTGAPFDSVVEKVEADSGGDGNLSQYLNDCGRDSLSQTTNTSTGLLDVDEISDGDLLSADIGNMHVILSDLQSPTRDLRTTHLPVTSKSNLSALFETTSHDYPSLEFHQTQTSIPETTPVAPPELCVVNMFWNDLPGLLMDGREYVRLVDIHRQVLPAKDTGILKKRCYMLGLDVRQCTELQRDFLVRYMNAAKSKSTVVVCRADAINLIGFYVTPKSKTRPTDADDVVIHTDHGVSWECDSVHHPQQSARNVSNHTQQQPLMTQYQHHHRLSSSSTAPQATATHLQSTRRRSSAEKTSPVEGVKRSERLRDRRVHYADMVHGINSRHGATDEADAESKTDSDTRLHHQNAAKFDVGHHESSARRTSSSERRAKSEAAAEPMHGVTWVNSRRRSMELRSSTEKHMDEFIDKLDMNPALTVSPPGGKRRISESDAARQDGISHTEKVEQQFAAKQPVAKLSRRNRGRFRNRHRAAAQRHRQLLASSAQHADTSPGQPVVHSSSETVISNHSVLNTVIIDESVMSGSTVAGGASEVVSNKLLKVDSGVVQNSMRCRDNSWNKFVKLSPRKYAVSAAAQASYSGGTESHGLKLDVGLANLVPVMHTDFSSRVGRRHHSQDGVVLLDHYVSADAACICCCSCSEFLSVAEFVSHMHNTTRLNVGSVRRLGPRGITGPEWHEFQRRRAQFSGTVCSTRTPLLEQVRKTAVVQEDSTPVLAVKPCTDNIKVEALHSGGTESHELKPSLVGEVGKSVDNSPVLPVVNENASSCSVVTLFSGHDVKGADMDAAPVPITEKVTESIDDCGSIDNSPLKATVILVTCPAAVEETPEPRITRSRHSNVELSTNVASVCRQTVTEDVVASGLTSRHNAPRSCKRVCKDSATTLTMNGSGSDKSVGSRPELRPRPPPRATAPK